MKSTNPTNPTIKRALEIIEDHGDQLKSLDFEYQKTINRSEAIAVQVAHLIVGNRRLFTSPHQYKLQKGLKLYNYATIGLNLSPALEAFKYTSVNACVWASDACKSSCLKYSGRNTVKTSAIARIARTVLWVHARYVFLQLASNEIRKWNKRCQRKGWTLAVRPNLLSDFPELATAIRERTPEHIEVYDYTASYDAMLLKDGVHRTFSRKETNDGEVWKVLRRQLPVAVVFAGDLPATFDGIPVIDGDKHDLRFIDANGPLIVGLKVKGVKNATKQRAIDSGFAIAA